ncbi:hypothetical protein [uncultured Porphyromonas sp.]|uniref:hypothetical protein n=1 Tax=uncultured Porphyromonas sp. TaxID=159274 RepID=UPI002805BD2D|nr:hypothetical protein [uncultured Porphyromonas sp.]
MSAIRDILHREERNRSQIYLYRRGIFYQAFDYSAYLLHHLVYPFEVTSHLNLKTKKRYYMVSFPIELLSSYPVTIAYDMTDGQLLRYTPSESAMASLPESYIRWCLRYTPVPATPTSPALEDTPTEQPADPVTSVATVSAMTSTDSEEQIDTVDPADTVNTADPAISVADPATSVAPTPCPPLATTTSLSDMVGHRKLSELLREIEQEPGPKAPATTTKCISYDLTLDEKAHLCDCLVSRILKRPSHRLCPLEALDQLDQLQEDLRQKLASNSSH